MTYDIVYSLRGDKHPARVYSTENTPEAAIGSARKLASEQSVIHVVITCEDGSDLKDTRNGDVSWLF